VARGSAGFLALLTLFGVTRKLASLKHASALTRTPLRCSARSNGVGVARCVGSGARSLARTSGSHWLRPQRTSIGEWRGAPRPLCSFPVSGEKKTNRLL